jgi:hypothetical protein
MRPSLLANVAPALADRDPSVRIAALGAFESSPPQARAQTVALLHDPVLGVRLEAARILADLLDEALPADAREARARALDELFRDPAPQTPTGPAPTSISATCSSSSSVRTRRAPRSSVRSRSIRCWPRPT